MLVGQTRWTGHFSYDSAALILGIHSLESYHNSPHKSRCWLTLNCIPKKFNSNFLPEKLHLSTQIRKGSSSKAPCCENHLVAPYEKPQPLLVTTHGNDAGVSMTIWMATCLLQPVLGCVKISGGCTNWSLKLKISLLMCLGFCTYQGVLRIISEASSDWSHWSHQMPSNQSVIICIPIGSGWFAGIFKHPNAVIHWVYQPFSTLPKKTTRGSYLPSNLFVDKC